MGRFRNPRYAPEWLERRLSPSAYPLGMPATVEVFRMDEAPLVLTPEVPLPTDPNGDPIPDPPPPPVPGVPGPA